VILGRRTFESMREDLPGTARVVLSRSDPEYDLESVHPASGLDEAVDVAESLDADRAYVLGGAAIYELFQPVVDRLLLSRIPEAYDGDAYFPERDGGNWTLVERTPYEGFTLEEWARDP
jgi:dihydrofolate reductase